MSELTKQICNDLKYPFGNQLLDIFRDENQLKALNNVLILAKERIWLAQDKPMIDDTQHEYSEDIDDLNTCHASVARVERMLEQLHEQIQ